MYEQRRALLTWLLAILLVGAVAPAAEAQTSVGKAQRPNFLFIYTDDQRWDALGVVQRLP